MKEIINNLAAFLELAINADPSSSRNMAFRFSTSSFLVDNFNFPKLDMYITEHTVRKIYNFHGVYIDFLKNLPILFENKNEEYISRIFNSNTRPDSSVVVSFEFIGQKPIIIAISKKKQINKNDFVNEISSVYEKDHSKDIFQQWEDKNLLIYKNPKKTLEYPKKIPIIIKKKSRT